MRIYALLFMVALALVSFSLSRMQALRAETQRAEAVLALATDRLKGLIERYRYLPAVLARSEEVRRGVETGDWASLSAILQRVADTSGAVAIGVSDLDGRLLASSRAAGAPGLLGSSLGRRPSLSRARLGGLGFTHGVDPSNGRRQFFFDHPVQDASGDIIAVLSIELDMEAIEADWRGDRDAIYFTDERGVIFISNRDELVLRAIGEEVTETNAYGGEVPEALPSPRSTVRRSGVTLWHGLYVPGLPEAVIHIARSTPRLGMTAHILSDLRPVYVPARIWALVGLLVGGVAALGMALFTQRRRERIARLEARAEAAKELELQVAERTAALSAEVEERRLAEAELRRVQADLVQAGKMAALGEMSAGISHELNQPLTAIQTLADNSEIFMAQGKTAPVAENLGRISQLAARAGRILKTLRSFARKEREPATEVDLREVIAEALAITQPTLATQETKAHWAPPNTPIMVMGGRVRLQQVLINLIGNAADAMAEQPDPRRITITVAEENKEIVLAVADTGPGLEDAAKIFDPFHTTKPVGQGLGLGLSISYGIVQQFGGKISGANSPEGGAVFKVHLQAAGAEEAAA